MNADPRIAYLTSRYPALSHSFIRREVAALRAVGVEVRTYSIRATPPAELLVESDRREAAQTESVLPASVGRLLGAHLWAGLRSPRRYLWALVRALRRRAPGVRALVWNVFYFAESAVLARMLHRSRITHLHCHFANAGADVGLLATELLGIDWSLTLHGTCDFEYPASETLGAKIRAARFVACVSHFGRAQAMRHVPVDCWPRIAVVRCGLDLTEFPFRQRPPADDRSLRLLCVCRISEEKGLPGLLLAFSELRRAGAAAELCIVGDGPDRAAVAALAERLGVASHCRLAGPLAGPELRRQLESADVFVLASLMEGLPVVLMEAMASGLPVVAPALSGIPELVEHRRDGLLFEPGNWRDLAAQIRALQADPRLRAALARAARDKVEARHRIEAVCEPLIGLFRSPDGNGYPSLTAEGANVECAELPEQ